MGTVGAGQKIKSNPANIKATAAGGQ